MDCRLALAPTLVLGLSGCGELVKDTGEACLIPQDLVCTQCFESEFDPEPGVQCQDVSWIPWEDGHDDCTGRYPAGVALELEAMLYEGGLGYAVREKCEVEVDGNRLIVTAKFWHEPERDAIVEPPAMANCDVPPLTAGTWILEYGDSEVEFEVGSDALLELVCVTSQHQHTRAP